MMDDGASLQPAVPKQIVYENTFLTGPDAYGPASLCLLLINVASVSKVFGAAAP